MGLECGWRHAQKRWSWEFEDFEKTVVEIRQLRREVEFIQQTALLDWTNVVYIFKYPLGDWVSKENNTYVAEGILVWHVI